MRSSERRFNPSGPVCAAAAVLAMLLAWGAGCDRPAAGPAAGEAPPAARGTQPNILWVVWDTVRSDHTSVYTPERRTTPFLEQFAREARVYTDVVSPGTTTVPSHGAMFTGLLPSEHGASNEKNPQLDERFETVAELLQAAGYATFAYSENPHICERNRFSQGFERLIHPWQPAYRDQAIAHVRSKIDPDDRSSELAQRVRATGQLSDWNIKTGGPIGRAALEAWWSQRGSDGRPWFAFLNYMDAHRHLIPARRFRERLMTPEQIAKSYLVDRTWDKTWAYCFGLADYSAEDQELTRLTYDAALAELDSLFEELIAVLQSRGELENTVVILTSDHGEHLGEHQLLDHQYSVYEPLLRVPLIVRYPRAFPPGRDDRPVTTLDLFPTLVGLGGGQLPAGPSQAVDLLSAPAQRARVGEYPEWTFAPVDLIRKRNRQHDFSRWTRSLRAYYDGNYKLICGSDGRSELYDLAADPGELTDLAQARPEVLARLQAGLSACLAGLTPPGERSAPAAQTPEEIDRLRELGYAGGPADEDDDEQGDDTNAASGAIVDHCPPAGDRP